MTKTIGPALRTVGLVGVLALLLSGCGGADGTNGDADIADLRKAKDLANSAGTPAGSSAEPVDACALFTASDFAEMVGKPAREPEVQPASGSMLGACLNATEDGSSSVHISTRPAREWDQSVKAYRAGTVSGVGAEAFWSDKTGLLVLPAGKPYFLQIIALPDTSNPTTFGRDLAIDAGKVAASR